MVESESPSTEDDLRNGTYHRRHDHLPTTVSPTTTSSRSTFHVEGDECGKGCRFEFKKRHVCVVVVFFLACVLVFQSRSQSGSISEADLRALNLLRQQQFLLYSLWNTTFSDHTNGSITSGSRSFHSSALIEDVKSSVIKDISLNKQIQSLLSQHGTNYMSRSGSISRECRRLNQNVSGRKTIEWKPRPNKFLFTICISGGMSSHLMCLKKHMFVAALLDRVLVIPSPKSDYDYSKISDIEHINACMERKVVVSFNEFIEKTRGRIDSFICYFSSPQPCCLDQDHLNKLKGLGISMGGKLGAAWKEDITRPSKRAARDVEAEFQSDDDVIAIGDVLYANVEGDWLVHPGGPVAHKCNRLIEPSRLIVITAQRFVQTFLGKDYVALHFRRHEFLKVCDSTGPSCFNRILQAADCIAQVVEKAKAPVVYLSTDAAESEISLLASLMAVNGKSVPLFRRPERDSAEKWDALLYRHGLEGDPQVEAMLDEAICAMSSVFIGSSTSTLTEDVLRQRKDWGTASSCDEFLCGGTEPKSIVEGG